MLDAKDKGLVVVALAIVLCLSLAVLISSFSADQAKGDIRALKVANKTQSVDIQKLIGGRLIKVPFRNISNRIITGYVLSRGPGNYIESCLTEDQYIHPGGVGFEEMPRESWFKAGGEQVTVTFEAVVFADQTYDGDENLAGSVLDFQHGELQQGSESLKLIEETLRASDEELPKAVASLKSDVDSMTIYAYPPVSRRPESVFQRQREVESGFNVGKHKMSRRIEGLQKITDAGALRSQLTLIHEECKRITTR